MVSGALLLQEVIQNVQWCSKRTISAFVNCAEYVCSIQLLTPERRDLARNICLRPYNYYNAAPPYGNVFETDKNLTPEQPGRKNVAIENMPTL